MKAIQKLNYANSTGKYICVGLDTDAKKLPKYLSSFKKPVVEFNKRIIDTTKNSAAAYKLNLAFYESQGITGLQNLEETLSFIPEDVLTIADGKRGDIGNTSNLYAHSIFDHFKFDAATLNPYMGQDSLEPFLSYLDKFNFILVLTSNPGSADFQKQKLQNGEFLYQEVTRKVHSWNKNSNCGIVFGATNLNELKENIDQIDNLPLLIPGVGAQGGSLEDVINLLFSEKKFSFLINVSRGIIQKSFGEDFADAASTELASLNNIIAQNSHLKK
ncbi:MAG: orotidine-5'-phosphate decarboxylase [Ignavibacteriaceae bacterium]|nr:orotidine-5'-phosphate decarboxylase [Ignavibacteriaceae bacterium]